MADQTRNYLKQRFDDGERPTGQDFADFLDSFLNKEDDKVRLVAGNNLSLPAGVILANAAIGAEGAMRFTGTEVQLFVTGSWKPIAGTSGAFVPVGAGPHVSFGGGNVGIGPFAVPPTHKLEVALDPNTATDRRARIGNLAIHTGTANDGAYISNQNNTIASSDQAFALKQDGVGNTTVNAPTGARVMLAQNNTARFQVLTSGNISMTPVTSVTVDGTFTIGSLATPRSMTVHGTAQKTGGGPFDPVASDVRVKKDVRPMQFGLREICSLNPVFYKFNGKAGTPADDKEYAGLIAQNVDEVLPFMVKKANVISDSDDRDILTYESGPLQFIMINAIRELSQRVEKLEAELASIKKAQ